MFTGLLSYTVVLSRAGVGTDRYGVQNRDWSTVTSVTSKAWISSGSREREDVDNREQERADFTVVFPPTVGFGAPGDVHSTDRIEFEGSRYELIGPLVPVRTPRGVHHYNAKLRRSLG